jgi:hypothetical protein
MVRGATAPFAVLKRKHLLARALKVYAEFCKDSSGESLSLANQTEHKMLGSDIVV